MWYANPLVKKLITHLPFIWISGLSTLAILNNHYVAVPALLICVVCSFFVEVINS